MYNVHRYNITVCRVGPADQFLEPCMCYYLEKNQKGKGRKRKGSKGKRRERKREGLEGKGMEGKERKGKKRKGNGRKRKESKGKGEKEQEGKLWERKGREEKRQLQGRNGKETKDVRIIFLEIYFLSYPHKLKFCWKYSKYLHIVRLLYL